MSEYRRNLAWNAGRKAFEAGKPRTANNRQRGTIFYDDWSDGYNDAESKAFHAARSAAAESAAA